jgi:acyl transferase domain-containing protein/NADPH:quinone reductase-like Zn-dependent oxidoreductase/acyl carrier protein
MEIKGVNPVEMEAVSLHEPVAIIGIGCRYPTVRGADEFWRLMLEGRDAIGPYPGGRFRDLDAEYERRANGEKGIASHLGGFLTDVEKFDAAFFGISPREAAYIDPQQRLLLEVSWDALEDAGQVKEQYYGSRTGVFTGLWNTDYETHIFKTTPKPEFYQVTGGNRSTACGRVSFTFGFEGPSIAVDTACSSSMVAVHLGCQSLQLGECDMALAGGANVVLSSDITRLFTSAGMLATDGHCKFGDQSANGFVRSEGAGMVVLKRLSDAVAAGDQIYAVIRGSSVNNDGSSSGYLVTPSRAGQKAMLQEAWRQAGIRGPELCYIEAHGTGTQVGDPVEIGAISDALREGGVTASGAGAADNRVPIGSVKTNIGHTESAAGVAGVIKSALVLHHGVIPGSLHLNNPNAAVDWVDGPVEIATATRELGAVRAGAVRMAGASSFGLTGTNSHVVLAEFAAKNRDKDGVDAPANSLLPISAYSTEALRALAESWMEYLDKDLSSAELAEICWLAGARRTHLANRFAAVGKDAAELRAQFKALVNGESSASPEAGVAGTEPVRVVFVCPGQGSQWDGMARDLLRENAAFRASFTNCDRVIAGETGWSLIERLEGPDAADALKEIDFVQPALFAMSVALAAVWRAAGVEPGAVVGHSMGEVAAAYLAGVLTLEDAAAVICRRSRLMRRLSGSGAMASVELPAVELSPWLESLDGRVSIAAANSPGTTVVSGEAEAVDQLLEWLELKEVFCRRVKVDVASHSALVDPILGELAETLAHLKPNAGSLPLFSTVDGAFADGAAMGAGYWVRNLREPVRLATATTALVGEGFNCFIELSPHPVLVNALEATLRGLTAGSGTEENEGIVLPSLLRGNSAGPVLLRSFGRFWIAGGKLDWAELTGGAIEGNGRRPKLPAYPFEYERFWEDAEEAVSAAGMAAAKLSPMLRAKTEPANEPGTTLFTVIADLDSLPYMVDHQVGGAIVFPAAGQIEIALEAARVLVPEPGVGRAARLENLAFKQAIYLSDSKADSDATELQLLVRKVAGKADSFGFALMGRQGGVAGAWVEHSTGSIVFGPVGDGVLASASLAEGAEKRVGSKDDHYRKTSARGIAYGPAFQLVAGFRVGEVDGIALAQGLLAGGETEGGDYLLHPALLDCTFQVVLEVAPRIPGTSERDVFMPSALRRIEVLRSPATFEGAERERLVSHAVCKGFDAAAGTMEFDLELRTEAGEVLVVVDGLTLQWVDSRGGERFADDLYKMSWTALGKLQALTPGSAIGKHWLIFADSGFDGGVEGSRGAVLARKLSEHGGRSTVVWLGDSFRPLGAGERRLDLLGTDEYELPVGGVLDANRDANRDAKALDELLRLVAAEAGYLDEVLDFWPLQSANGESGLEAWMMAQAWGSKFAPTLVQAIQRAGWADMPRLWLMTDGVQSVADVPLTERSGPVSSLASATVSGVGAVVMHEHPELSASVIDLGSESEAEIESLVRLVLDEARGAVARKMDREDRLALRGDAIFAARFAPCPGMGSEVEETRSLEPCEAYKVDTKKPGTLDQMPLRAIPDPEPGAGEVAIEVGYVGLNFIDVTKALGIYPGIDPKLPVGLGGECSGRIVAVGAGVEGLSLGDEVVAMTTSPMRVGLTASRVVLPAELVLPKPAKLTRAEAAGLPIAYLTAYYSLVELGRLRKGEWVLIHAGAGGVGLAAAQIALALGAKVIATASSPEKHAFLHQWGVEHVLQSRTLEFADGVMEITGGKGVDMVLNSLAGDFIPKSIEVLAPYGRFVELGKRDIYDDKRVGLKGFRNNISYFVVDLAALVEDRRSWAAEMFREVMKAVEADAWAALPVASYAASETADAMQFMAQGKHIGKLLVKFAGEGTGPRGGMMVLPRKSAVETTLFRRDASYIITGGLGGVGAAAAEWMAQNGAGCVVVVSRREAGPEQLEVLRRVREAGAVAVHRRTDILDRAAVDALMAEIVEEMPPLRGVLHAAAVVDDALVMDLTPERFDAVYGPKVRGTWNLHEATLGLELDFFQMFSSIAVPFPQLGHGSYSAANAFLDAFAGYRRGLGLPATTINWSGWLNLGLARATGTQGSIDGYTASGLGSFERDEALHVLGEAIRIAPQQALAVRLDGEQVAESYEVIPALLRDLIQTEGTAAGAVASQEHPALAELSLAEGYAERLAKLEEMLRGETSRVLKLAPERIKVNQAFGQMGIDSLMALEFIRRVNASLGLALPATAVFNYPTITQLAAQILKRLGLDSDTGVHAVKVQVPGRSADVVADSQMLSELSDEDALRALMEPGELSSGD